MALSVRETAPIAKRSFLKIRKPGDWVGGRGPFGKTLLLFLNIFAASVQVPAGLLTPEGLLRARSQLWLFVDGNVPSRKDAAGWYQAGTEVSAGPGPGPDLPVTGHALARPEHGHGEVGRAPRTVRSLPDARGCRLPAARAGPAVSNAGYRSPAHGLRDVVHSKRSHFPNLQRPRVGLQLQGFYRSPFPTAPHPGIAQCVKIPRCHIKRQSEMLAPPPPRVSSL